MYQKGINTKARNQIIIDKLKTLSFDQLNNMNQVKCFGCNGTISFIFNKGASIPTHAVCKRCIDLLHLNKPITH